MKLATLFLVLVFLLTGCSTKPFVPPAVCEGQQSIILSSVKDPQALDKGLLMVNLIALDQIDGYEPADATKVLNQIDAMVAKGGMTYAEMVGYIFDKLEVANALAGGAMFIIGDDLMALDQSVQISACDIALIRAHLSKQRVLIAMYGTGR